MGARKLSYYEEESLTKMTLFSKGGTRIFTKKSQKNRLDYYPFGMLLPNRHESASEYRYGFNGMDKDDEVSGVGNSYTTEFRQYDSRIGRWGSTDPVTHAQYSPYSAFDNNPIYFTDPSGADSHEPVYTNEKQSELTVGENSVTITSTQIQTIERTIKDGVYTKNIKEVVTTINSTTITPFLNKQVNIDYKEESIQTIKSYKETEVVFNGREEDVFISKTTEQSLSGTDGTTIVNIADQESVVQDYSRAFIKGLKQNVNYRGVQHGVSDNGSNIISGVSIGVGVYNPLLGGAIALGQFLGNIKRNNDVENNFEGVNVVILREYEKFKFNADGEKENIETLKEYMGGLGE
jgi:RHS repeat-associated protein